MPKVTFLQKREIAEIIAKLQENQGDIKDIFGLVTYKDETGRPAEFFGDMEVARVNLVLDSLKMHLLLGDVLNDNKGVNK